VTRSTQGELIITTIHYSAGAAPKWVCLGLGFNKRILIRDPRVTESSLSQARLQSTDLVLARATEPKSERPLLVLPRFSADSDSRGRCRARRMGASRSGGLPRRPRPTQRADDRESESESESESRGNPSRLGGASRLRVRFRPSRASRPVSRSKSRGGPRPPVGNFKSQLKV
jgi:hypothetical protein